MKALLALAPLVLGFVALIWLHQLELPPNLGPCPSLQWLGRPCASCGGTRMILALSHGQFARAWSLNPLWLVLLPWLALSSYWALLYQLWPQQIPRSPWHRWPLIQAIGLIVVVLLFSFWRIVFNPPFA